MFRLDVELVDRLKDMARKNHRSLNNLVECILLEVAYREPNEETLAAMKEAKEGKTYGPIDISSVEAMLKSMDL